MFLYYLGFAKLIEPKTKGSKQQEWTLPSPPFIGERIIWALGKLRQLRSMVEFGVEAGEPGLEAGASLEQVVEALIDNLQRARWRETDGKEKFSREE